MPTVPGSLRTHQNAPVPHGFPGATVDLLVLRLPWLRGVELPLFFPPDVGYLIRYRIVPRVTVYSLIGIPQSSSTLLVQPSLLARFVCTLCSGALRCTNEHL